MSQPTTHQRLNTVPFAQPRRALRRAWVALVLGAVCGLATVTANAKPMSESAIQSRVIRSDEAGVVLQTRRGDSLRTIAQYYSVKNNIPFKHALAVLTQTNQAQFPGGDPDRMQVGAQIILPKQNGAKVGENSETEPTAVVANPVTETTVAPSACASMSASANGTQTAPVPKTEASTQSVPPSQVELTAPTHTDTVVAQGGVAQLKAWLLRVPKSLWLVIIPALLLSALVGLMMRGSRHGKDHKSTDLMASDAVEKNVPSTTAVSPAVDQTLAPIAAQAAISARAHSDKLISDEAVDSWLNGSETPAQVVAASTQAAESAVAVVPAVQAPKTTEPQTAPEVTAAQVELAKTAPVVAVETSHAVEQDEELGKNVADETLDVKPEAAQEIELRFKQALHGLTPEKLDLRSTSASKVQLDMPVTTVTPTMPAAPHTATPTAASTNTMPASSVTSTAPSDSGTSGLNVNHLLRQYANHTAEKSGQAVNYYALAERTRLQKWMSAQSIDDLLDHAQKAYAQAYPNVAHHILNEVILRGNAAQSTQALDLRNQWHIQYLRQQAQESRGH